MIDSLGGRKTIVGVILVLVGVALEVFKGLTPTMVNYLLGMAIGYFAGNGIEHMSGALRSFAENKAQPPAQADMAPVLSAIEELPGKLPAPSPGTDPEVMKDLHTGIKAIVNQNAIMASSLNTLTQGTEYLVRVVQANSQK